MGKTFSTGLLTNGLWQDASNNIGIGGSPSGSYKLEVTGTSNFTGVLRVGAATGFAVGSIAGYRRIEYTGTTFSMLTNADGYAALSAGAAIFSENVLIGATTSTGAGNRRLQVTGSGAAQLLVSNTTSTGHIALYSTGVDAYITKNTASGTMYFGLAPQDGSTFTNQLAIASTGAATFSSSVQADGGSNGFLINQNGGAAGLATYSANTDRAQIAFKYAQNYPASNNYTRVLDIVSTGDATGTGIIRLLTSYNGQNPSAALTLLAGGAATFSSLAGISSRTVTADASGTLSASSDSSLKQEDTSHKIEGLAEILQLQPRAYKWLNDIEIRGEEATTEIGFFANEVAPIIPSAAPKTTNDLYGFYDRAVIAALVKAIQELSAQNQDLKSRLDKAGL